MSSSDPDVNRLQEQTEQGRLDLIRSDLELLNTLANLVESKLKLGNREHARETFTRAEKGYEDVSRIFEKRNLWGEKATSEIREKLEELREELDRVQRLFGAAGTPR